MTALEKSLMEKSKKTNKNVLPKLKQLINLEAKAITTKFKINERFKFLATNPGFITLKDRKNIFHAKRSYRFLNTCKNQLGKISKKNWMKSINNLLKT